MTPIETLELLVSKHEEMETAKAILEEDIRTLTAVLHKERAKTSENTACHERTLKEAQDALTDAECKARETSAELVVKKAEIALLQKELEGLRGGAGGGGAVGGDVGGAVGGDRFTLDIVARIAATFEKRELGLKEFERGLLLQERKVKDMESKVMADMEEQLRVAAYQKEQQQLLQSQWDNLNQNRRELERVHESLLEKSLIMEKFLSEEERSKTVDELQTLVEHQRQQLLISIDDLHREDTRQQAERAQFERTRLQFLQHQREQARANQLLQEQIHEQMRIIQLQQQQHDHHQRLQQQQQQQSLVPSAYTGEPARAEEALADNEEWIEEVLLVKEISEEMLRAEHQLTCRLTRTLEEAATAEVHNAEHDIALHQRLISTVHQLNNQVAGLQDQERHEVQELHLMLANAQRLLEESNWRQQHVQHENEWLRVQLGCTLSALNHTHMRNEDPSLQKINAEFNHAAAATGGNGEGGGHGEGGDEGMLGGGTRDSLNRMSAPEIGIRSLNVALDKMSMERLLEQKLLGSFEGTATGKLLDDPSGTGGRVRSVGEVHTHTHTHTHTRTHTHTHTHIHTNVG